MDERLREVTRGWTLAQPAVAAFLTSVVRDFRERDDLLQDVAVAVIESFDSYDESRPFTPWAIGIARHRVGSWLRSRRRARVSFDSAAVEQLAAAFAAIPADDYRRLDRLAECLGLLESKARQLCELPPAAVGIGRHDPDLLGGARSGHTLGRLRRDKSLPHEPSMAEERLPREAHPRPLPHDAPRFIQVIDNCNTVAIDTQTKYGPCATATHGLCRHTETIIHRSVPQMTRMSTAASGRFRSPNWIGVKARFAARLIPNGTATIHGIRLRPTCTNTNRNVTAITG